MMPMKKHGPGLAIIIGGPKRPDSDEEAMDEGDEDMSVADEAKASAVKDFFSAYKKNDVSAGVAAMDAFLEACGYGESNETESEGESESAK